MEAEDESNKTEQHCDTLIMCTFATLNEALRNEGGISDILHKPSSTVNFTRQLPIKLRFNRLSCCAKTCKINVVAIVDLFPPLF